MTTASIIPSEDHVKSVLIIGGVAAAVYVVWKMYNAGSSIKDTVSKTLSDASDKATALYHSADLAATRIGARGRAALAGGAVPGTGDDQSAAESARLGSAEAAATVNEPTVDVPSYDAMGNYQGMTTEPAALGMVPSGFHNAPQLDGPDAAGLSTPAIDVGQGDGW